jgi:hypothetical protein
VNTLSFAAYLQMRKPVRRWDSCLLIFDQFEEVLTADPLDEEAKLEFFSEVGTALRDSSTWALFAIRERHLAALNPYTRALPSRLKSSMRLDLLHLDGAYDAIEKPAAAHGVHFTGDAVKRLVDDLREVAVQARDGTSKLGSATTSNLSTFRSSASGCGSRRA